MSNPQEILLAHTLSSLNSSLSVLTQLNLLSEHEAREIRGKLPLPTALNQQQPSNNGPWTAAGQSSSGNSWEGNNTGGNNGGPSHPYPAPIYGQGTGGGGGGGGAARAPPPLPGRSYPGLGEARAVWDYHGGAPDDLIFRKDDIIVIDEEMNAEWYKGHLSTDRSLTPRIGLFPSNYVTKIPPSDNGYRSPNVPQPNHSSSQYFNQPPPSQQQPWDDKSQYNNPSPAPYQQQNQMQPYAPPPQQVVQAPPPEPPKKQGNGFGKLLATSAVGGVGFGAGSAVGSGIIHAIF